MDKTTIYIIIIGITISSLALYLTQSHIANMRQQRIDSQIEIDKMDCQQLKLRAQMGDGTEGKSADVAGFRRAAIRYHALGCEREWGYFDSEHNKCTVIAIGRYDPRFCLQKNFPMYQGSVVFPEDWFYKDPKTGKITDNPNEILQKIPWTDDYWIGVDVTTEKFHGVKNPNFMPLDCLFYFYPPINAGYPYWCNYNMTVNGVVHDRNTPDGILHKVGSESRYTTVLDQVPEFPEIRCWRIIDEKYSHECKYFEANELVFKVRKQ
jgi:hypothetical protein